MAHLFLDSTCRALIDRLQEADRQRDHLRAQLADAALQVELKEVDRNLPWGAPADVKARVKAEREAALQERISKRAARRANEMRIFQDLDYASHDQRCYGYPYPIKAGHDRASLTEAERVALRKMIIAAAVSAGMKRSLFRSAAAATGHE